MEEDKELLLPKGVNGGPKSHSYGSCRDQRSGLQSSARDQPHPHHSLTNESVTPRYISNGGWPDRIPEKGFSSSDGANLNVVGLSYTVRERPGHWWSGSCFRPYIRKRVLNNLCLHFQSGELTALLGSSGAGKTSILDVIAGRSEGEVKGVVSYNNEICTRSYMRRCSSYVLQADRLLSTLTVREMLTYMAYLKLPGHFTHVQIGHKVDDVIAAMGLRHVAQTRIGGAVIRGVSGGEKRRITIGIELLKDPEILLLDEPTSGLDAFTARHLVSSLSKLAHQGKMVIMSIHQPRSDIFNLLDKLVILTLGRLAFLGRPDQLVPYFTSIGYPCPLDRNPLDVYIDVTSIDSRDSLTERKTRTQAMQICDTFSNSDLQTDVVKGITRGFNFCPRQPDDSVQEERTDSNTGPSWIRTFSCLLSRMNTHLYRDRPAFVGRILFLPFFIPFFAMFTGQLKSNQASIQDRLGVIYQSSQVPPYMGLTNALGLFPTLRDLYYRECSDGLYSTYTFLLAYFVHILPFNMVSGVLFASGLYWALGLNSDLGSFGQFVALSVILTQFGEMLSVAFLGWFRDVQVANVVSGLAIGSSSLFASGLMRSLETMPKVLYYAGYIAVHKYATEIYVYDEFHGLQLECDKPGEPCYKTGDEFIQGFYPGIESHTERNWGMVCAYFLSIWLFAAIVFKVRGNPTLH